MIEAATVRRAGAVMSTALVAAGAFLGFRMAEARGAGDSSTVWAVLLVIVLLAAAAGVLLPRWLGLGASGDGESDGGVGDGDG